MSDDSRPAVRVHLASSDVPAGGAQPAAKRRVSCRPYTVVLTSTNPTQTILDLDGKRAYALLQAGGYDVVINNSHAEAQNSANTTSGLPGPIGMVLTCGNTAPTKVPGGEHWYATAAQYPAQVTVLVVQED